MSFMFLDLEQVSIGLEPKLSTAPWGEATYSAVAQRNVWKLQDSTDSTGPHGAVSLWGRAQLRPMQLTRSTWHHPRWHHRRSKHQRNSVLKESGNTLKHMLVGPTCFGAPACPLIRSKGQRLALDFSQNQKKMNELKGTELLYSFIGHACPQTFKIDR